MRLKRIIAREWLIFLLFFFLSPAVLAVYRWTSTPKETTDTSQSSSLYPHFIPDDQIPILREKLSKLIPKPPAGSRIVPVEDLPDHSIIQQAEQWGILSYPKRPFWNYLTDTIKDSRSYLQAIFIIYPLFLLARSILWSIRTVRRIES